MNDDATISLRIELSGSSYSPELDKAITNSLPDNVAATVCGEKAPAAGPELLINFFINCTASFLTERALGKLINGVLLSITEHVEHKPTISKVVCETPSFEIVIVDLSFLDERVAHSDWSNIDQVIAETSTLAKAENNRGRSIVRITTPCEVRKLSNQMTVCRIGSGNTSCWLVEYANRITHPTRAYDSRNAMFIELNKIESLLDSHGDQY